MKIKFTRLKRKKTQNNIFKFSSMMLVIIFVLSGCGKKNVENVTESESQEMTEHSEETETIKQSDDDSLQMDETEWSESEPEETKESLETEIVETAESLQDIFSELNGLTFIFSSGAGAWSTEVYMGDNGTFTGYYHDSNMGENGAEYPNGTRYECDFEGKFSVNMKIDDLTYSLKLDNFIIKDSVDEEKIIDGVRIITTDAYGFDHADEFLLYLPGRSTADLDDDFLGWVRLGGDISVELPFYGLYNVEGKMGFFSGI